MTEAFKPGENPFAPAEIQPGENPFASDTPTAPRKPFIESLADEAVATGGRVARQGKLLVRSLASAALSPAALVGDATNKFINGAGQLMGYDPQLQMPSHKFQEVLDATGLPRPETGIEKLTQGLAESAPSVALPAGLVPQALGSAALGATQAAPGGEGSGAIWGGIGGGTGHALARTMAGLVKPTQQARVLMDRGVALTPGQAAGAGSAMKKVEEHAAGWPVASHFVKNAQRRAVSESNVAAAKAVTDMVDKDLKLGMPPREAIEGARDAVSKTYDFALEGMAAPGKDVKAILTSDISNFPDAFPLVPMRDLRQMRQFVDTRLGLLIENSPGGVLDGPVLKQLDSEIGQHVRNLQKSTNAADKTAAPAWSELQQSLRDAMALGQKDTAKLDKLVQANRAYRQLLSLEKALLPGAETFTPRRLATQLDKADIKSGPLRDVSNAMTATLPNTVSDSGTTERLLMSALPAALLGGGAAANEFGYTTLGAGAMAAGALGSRPGARALTGGYGVQKMLSPHEAQMAATLATMLRNRRKENQK